MKCPVCGKEFTPKAPNQRYCSQDCKREMERKQNREYYHKNKNRPRIRKKKHSFSDTLIELKKTGKTYAEMQQEKTIERYARIGTSKAATE